MSIDFITSLPSSKLKDIIYIIILVVVDKFI